MTAARPDTQNERLFWNRPGLDIVGGRLTIAGRDAETLAREHGTPLYAFDLQRVAEMVRGLQGALARAGLRHMVRLAMKAQREPEVLGFVRGLGDPGSPEAVGLDVCSPREVLHGLAMGWSPEEISYTGTNVLPGEDHLDLDAYAGILARQLGPLDVLVTAEPGDFLFKESGVLLAEVVTVEDRLGTTFVGLDAGWNVMHDRFIYDVPFEVSLCQAADAAPIARVTISGHINEGNDLFAEDYPMPKVREGDIVAIINCGGYNQAMTLEHCLRPPAGAVYFEERLPTPDPGPAPGRPDREIPGAARPKERM